MLELPGLERGSRAGQGSGQSPGLFVLGGSPLFGLLQPPALGQQPLQIHAGGQLLDLAAFGDGSLSRLSKISCPSWARQS